MAAVGKASMVFKGVAFEQRSLKILQSQMSMSLRRVGGASDGGVDLLGWWYLPYLPPSASSVSPELLERDNVDTGSGPLRRVRVLAQCKAYAKKIPPSMVREMEGVLYQYSRTGAHKLVDPSAAANDAGLAEMPPRSETLLVALLISQSPFTRQTILRAMSSTVPFLLLHLPSTEGGVPTSKPKTGSSTSSDDEIDSPRDLEQDSEAGNGKGARAEGAIGSALWNQALSGPSGLLGGQFELRWQRSTNTGAPSSSSGPEIRGADTAGYPSLWWRGKVIRGLVPLTSGVETDGSFDAL